MARFALRTTDTDWVERHNGWFDPDTGLVHLLVDGAKVERFSFAGVDHLRFDLTADCPRDMPSGHVVCPFPFLEDAVVYDAHARCRACKENYVDPHAFGCPLDDENDGDPKV